MEMGRMEGGGEERGLEGSWAGRVAGPLVGRWGGGAISTDSEDVEGLVGELGWLLDCWDWVRSLRFVAQVYVALPPLPLNPRAWTIDHSSQRAALPRRGAHTA